jgi:hypothetical protein
VLEDGQGEQWIVDLNVRPTGSFVLGLLKGFLSNQRGLRDALLVSSTWCAFPQEEFIRNLAQEFAEGKVIIVAWVEDDVSGDCWASLVVGAKTKNGLAELWQNIKQVKGGDGPTRV